MIYGSIVGTIVGILTATGIAVNNGWIRVDPLMRLLIAIPGVGSGLKTVAMSRLTWSLALATDSDINPLRVVDLAVRTTQNSYYTSRLDQIKEVIGRGGEFYEAFDRTGVFPPDFLGALQAGEIGGRISESMEVLAKEYEERTKLFYRVMATAAGIGVFLVVAALIIFMIFSLFSQYLDILNDASQI
jgi:type II secretory pathway component PulF